LSPSLRLEGNQPDWEWLEEDNYLLQKFERCHRCHTGWRILWSLQRSFE